MVRNVLSHRAAKQFSSLIQQFQMDIHNEWHNASYDCWRVKRPNGWVDGSGVETDVIVESGYGRLYPNGPGGPQSNEAVIFLESPYRFRTDVRAGFRSGYLLVIGVPGDPNAHGPMESFRLFRVDNVKPGNPDSVLMDVYLTELFNTPYPGGS